MAHKRAKFERDILKCHSCLRLQQLLLKCQMSPFKNGVSVTASLIVFGGSILGHEFKNFMYADDTILMVDRERKPKVFLHEIEEPRIESSKSSKKRNLNNCKMFYQ